MKQQKTGPMLHPILVVTAPSGGGKSTLARHVMEHVPELQFSVSVTTRAPRAHEVDGVHYHFLDADTFWQRVEEGDLLEYEEVYPGRFYGTLRSEVERVRKTNPVLLDVEVKGAQNVKRIFGDEALTIFIQPPSFEVLRDRLVARKTEDENSLRVRLERAQWELTQAETFDVVLINDDLEAAKAEALRIVSEALGKRNGRKGERVSERN